MAKISKRGSGRYEKFIQAGLEIFLEKGYEDTSLTDIIEKSGGSLASIYKFFDNKEGLFRAILERGFDSFSSQIDEKINLKMSHKLEDFLTKFATIFFDIMCDKKTTLISRIIIMEGPKNGGKLSRDFLDQVLNRVDKILIDFFNQGDIKSQLNPNIPIDKLAPLFTALIRNPYHYDSVVLNEPIILTTLEKKEHIKMCVSLFLDGILKR